MRFFLRFLLVLSLFAAPPADAAPINLTAEGIEIEGGSLGKFTLGYPLLLNDQQAPAHKLLGTDLSGQSAALTYDGGAKIEVIVGDDGKITFRPSSLPA